MVKLITEILITALVSASIVGGGLLVSTHAGANGSLQQEIMANVSEVTSTVVDAAASFVNRVAVDLGQQAVSSAEISLDATPGLTSNTMVDARTAIAARTTHTLSGEVNTSIGQDEGLDADANAGAQTDASAQAETGALSILGDLRAWLDARLGIEW